jgi:hypothetical protein
MLNLAVWVAATGHGVMVGSDRDQAWLLAVYSVAAVTIAGALAFRIGRVSHPVGRLLVPAAAAATALALVLGLASVQEATQSSGTRVSAPTGFAGDLSGTISTEVGRDTQLVSVSGKAGDTSDVLFRIDLVTAGNRIIDTSLQLRFDEASTADVCAGELSEIDNAGFSGTCTLADGTTRTVRGTWSVSDEEVHGQLTSKA